jgi:hypothetical protein
VNSREAVQELVLIAMRDVREKYANILDSLKEFYGDKFDEALNRSLSRVHMHSQDRSIGIMSANRADNSLEQNNAAKLQLAKDIQARNYGFAHVAGVGQEEGGPSSEPSFLVIGPKGEDKHGTLKRHLKDLGRKFDQMGILYKGHGEDSAKFIHTSDEHFGKEEDLGQWHPNDSAAMYFTKLKGERQFSFSFPKKEAKVESVVYLMPRGFFCTTAYSL